MNFTLDDLLLHAHKQQCLDKSCDSNHQHMVHLKEQKGHFNFQFKHLHYGFREEYSRLYIYFAFEQIQFLT